MTKIIFNEEIYSVPEDRTPYWRDCETDKKRVVAAVDSLFCTLCWMMPEGYDWEENDVESFDFFSREPSYVVHSENNVEFNPKDPCKEKLEELWILQKPLRRRKI